ncbi:PaaX family transcriptional regulator C-terminal domain-containing protein [Micromonospora sp. HM5-17]|uniref:PaaX family transcriptional regulator n=1 Tax=Micromonospora sp. HM5-17 TaxID=2487710 RepID=UPI000F4A84B7|nr:PaaX family transcriptional regulator C-terminal domain-containing protein [Micromonospora sp. HM5-17]ROT33823.1 PaaX family transcriptional regulator [Micromonospora sp. HM5-17]
MVSPFDIEEIFPDVVTGSVRLPRRQSRGSPQSLAVTLLADYTLRTRAWLPSAAIVALLAESGVTTTGGRTAISRLTRRGVIESRRHGRHSSYRLTRPAADNLVHGGRQIARFAVEAESWDGWWTLIAFSLPQQASAERRALRGQLRWQGYAPLYDGLWVSPHDLNETVTAELSKIAPGATSVFRARHVEIEAIASQKPVDAWDTAALARQYDDFIQSWSALLPRVHAGAVTGAAAVRARTEVMEAYRRFPTLDPLLPLRLMPAGWPRQAAREVFAAVYDGLAVPAQEYVRAVAGRYGAARLSDIRAHTTTELRDLVPGPEPRS